MAHRLVIQLARFGDMVQTKRLLLSLAAFPDDAVHLVVDVSLAPLARLLYPFAIVHAVHAHATGADAAKVLAHNREAFAVLGAISFASVYNLNFSGMALALAGLFDPDVVRGYIRRNGQAMRSPWLRLGFRWMRDRRIAPLNLVDFWAHLHPSPLLPSQVNPIAAPRNAGPVAVVASGREARRSLPPDVLAPVVEAVFAARGGPEIRLFGSTAERPFARRLTRLFRPSTLKKTTDLCGVTRLEELPEHLADCGLVLTPDTGIMHLAASMGIPVSAFFLSSAWCFETGPYGEGHTVFQATRGCAPCVESQPCPRDTACLAPFTSPGLLAALRGRDVTAWPKGLVLLRSVYDDFGCDYTAVHGEFPECARRSGLRALLAEYAGCPLGGDVPAWAAEAAFHETDWMMPPDEGASAVFGEV